MHKLNLYFSITGSSRSSLKPTKSCWRGTPAWSQRRGRSLPNHGSGPFCIRSEIKIYSSGRFGEKNCYFFRVMSRSLKNLYHKVLNQGSMLIGQTMGVAHQQGQLWWCSILYGWKKEEKITYLSYIDTDIYYLITDEHFIHFLTVLMCWY